MSTAKNYNVIFSSGQRTLYRWRVCVCGFSIRHISFEGSTNWIYVWHRVVIDSICWAWNRCQNSRRHKKKVCIFGIELSEANELCVWHMCHALFPVLTTHFPVHIVPKNNVSPVWACHKLESNFYFPGIARLSHRRTDEFGWFEFYLYISCVQLLAAHRTRRRKRWNEYTTRQHICNGDYIDEWQNSNKMFRASATQYLEKCIAVKVERERTLRVQCWMRMRIFTFDFFSFFPSSSCLGYHFTSIHLFYFVRTVPRSWRNV